MTWSETRVSIRCRVIRSDESICTIGYRIGIGGKTHTVASNHTIAADDWDSERRSITPTEANVRTRHRIRWEMAQLRTLAHAMLDEQRDIDMEALAESFGEIVARQSFTLFATELMETVRAQGKTRRHETYRTALSSLTPFLKGEDIMLYEMTPETMEAYQEYLKGRGLSMNTISFYMRQLRAIFNRAVRQRITPQTYPFANVYTGRAETAKRALCRETIAQIRRADLSANPAMAFARDMFMLSFYLRGISFVDMAYMKKSNLTDGYLTYNRRKTGQRLTIRWEPAMQEIVERYANDGEYLLPFLRPGARSEHRQYKNASKTINRNLKRVARELGIESNLTMYVSRHSWASIAKQKEIPIGIISESLGHDSERTTQIYLATLDTKPVDEANRAIIEDV